MDGEKRRSELTEEQLDHVARLLLGQLVEQVVLLHGVPLQDIYTDSIGEQLYTQLTEIFHLLSPELKGQPFDNGEFAPELEQALTLVDRLMYWCMCVGIQEGRRIEQYTEN